MEQSSHLNLSDPTQILHEGALLLGIPLSPHVSARLILYLKELKRWNAKTNLTAIESDRNIICKHFLDSLAALKVFTPRPGLRILDIGTGAGFPGLVLKLHAPELHVTLIEPSMKKVAFLHHIVGLLGITGVEIFPKRLEQFVDGKKFELITGRALNPEVILNGAEPLLAPRGRVLLFRIDPGYQPATNYRVTNEVSFTLPLIDLPRTLTLLRLSHDEAFSDFSTLVVRLL